MGCYHCEKNMINLSQQIIEQPSISFAKEKEDVLIFKSRTSINESRFSKNYAFTSKKEVVVPSKKRSGLSSDHAGPIYKKLSKKKSAISLNF